MIKAIDASSAYPGFFEPVNDIDGRTYYDGGTSFSINIGGAINRCKELGYKESDITIDIILNSAAITLILQKWYPMLKMYTTKIILSPKSSTL